MQNSLNIIYSKIFSKADFSAKSSKVLTDIGFLYPENAWNNLKNISELIREIDTIPNNIFLELLLSISESFEPDRALNNLEKFFITTESLEKYLNIIRENEEFLKNIISLFSGSQVFSDIAIKDNKKKYGEPI